MSVTHLFLKRCPGTPMETVTHLACDRSSGILFNTPCLPFRQVLITQKSTPLTEIGIQAGDLRENIVIDCENLYDLASGTVIMIGSVLIRLTFHCETCGKVPPMIREKIFHKRGYLGSFLNSGSIRMNDEVKIIGKIYDSIPYDIPLRIQWYLDANPTPISSSELLREIGLSSSYARALPRYLSKLPIHYQDKIIFKNHVIRPSINATYKKE